MKTFYNHLKELSILFDETLDTYEEFIPREYKSKANKAIDTQETLIDRKFAILKAMYQDVNE